MKSLIVLCAAVAVCVARPGYFPGLLVPAQDTAEVAVAKIAHFAAHAQARAANGIAPPPVQDTPEVAAAKIAHFAAHAAAGSPFLGYGYAGLQHIPILTPQGVPVDTPEVQAARAANAAAHLNAKAGNFYG